MSTHRRYSWWSSVVGRARAALVLGALALCVGSLPVDAAWAQGAPGRQVPRPKRPVVNKVEVQLQVVYATNEHTRVDPKLRDVMQSLRVLRFSGFELLSTERAMLGVGQETTLSVAGGRKLKVQLVSRTEEKATMRLRMVNARGEQRWDTTVSVHRNRSFVVGGPRYRNGKLVLPVSALY